MSLIRKLYNNYSEVWDTDGWSVSDGTIYKERTLKGTSLVTAAASFSLTKAAEIATLTVYGYATADAPDFAELRIRLFKPGGSSVTLYTGDGGPSHIPLNEEDITSHLSSVGEYTLQLEATLTVEGTAGYTYAQYATLLLLVGYAPENLEATAQSQTRINTTWDADSGADSYTLYWKEETAESWNSEPGITETEFLVEDLEEGTLYQFRLSSVNTYGESPLTDVVEESTYERPEVVLVETVALTDTDIIYRYLLLKEAVQLHDVITAVVSVPTQAGPALYAGTSTGELHYFDIVHTQESFVTTPSFDFGSPEYVKTLSHVTLKGDPPSPLAVSVYGSTDEGTTWTHLGNGTLERTQAATLYCWFPGATFLLKIVGTGLYLKSVIAAAIGSGQR